MYLVSQSADQNIFQGTAVGQLQLEWSPIINAWSMMHESLKITGNYLSNSIISVQLGQEYLAYMLKKDFPIPKAEKQRWFLIHFFLVFRHFLCYGIMFLYQTFSVTDFNCFHFFFNQKYPILYRLARFWKMITSRLMKAWERILKTIKQLNN